MFCGHQRAVALTILALAVGLTGCVGAAVNTTTLAAKGLPRADLKQRASEGDAEAQYQLGQSYCCMGPGFDTQTATEWYCLAARQGHAGAMFELGRIYRGDISRTPAPGQKLLRGLTAKQSLAHAWYWLSLSADGGHDEAHALLRKIDGKMSAEERDVSEQMLSGARSVPCEYGAVFVD